MDYIDELDFTNDFNTFFNIQGNTLKKKFEEEE
jgi:hypothetical protein